MLTPTGTFCEDAWLVTAALLRETSTLKFLVAFRPGVINPMLAAQMAAAYQRISGGRLLLNVVTGGEPREQARFGDTDPKADAVRADRRVPLGAARRVGAGRRSTSRASTSEVEGALVEGGIDPRAGHLLRRLLGPGRPGRGQARRRLPDLGRAAGAGGARSSSGCAAWPREQGRTLRFGLRVHTLSRDTSEEAWRHAQWLLDGLDPATDRGGAGRRWPPASPTGQQRMLALHGGRTSYTDARELEVSPNLWAGVGLVRGGAGTALVGSHDEVADRLEEYHALGIDEFILSGYPHVEEAYWFGEGVMPRLRDRGLLGGAGRTPHGGGVGLTGLGRFRVSLRWTRGRRDLGSTHAHPHAPRRHLDLVRLPAPGLRRRAARRRVHAASRSRCCSPTRCEMVTRIGSAVGDWVARLRVQPGRLARGHPGRRLGGPASWWPAFLADRGAGAEPDVRGSGEKPARKELAKGKGTKKEPVLSDVDPEMAEIEALLRKRGIT